MVASSLGQLTISCFGPDLTFDCATFIPAFCNSIGNSTIAQIDSMARCFNVPASGGRCDFTAANMLTDPSTPIAQNCGVALETVSQRCPSGGSGQFTGLNFRFWIDPNTGGCPIPEF
ncbi:hypothetical protein FB451DRAFT_1534685 [Mycena latifolia]|nr:hypothetical protein FB451DRAFT_1534685 [Mycena latifolia]